ncbi:MAG: hypothetical protein LBB85_08550 [Dysgonamonadaceae bacterium]|nr:hypothetical protein [Dysgonamonadaceae bacterium]
MKQKAIRKKALGDRYGVSRHCEPAGEAILIFIVFRSVSLRSMTERDTNNARSGWYCTKKAFTNLYSQTLLLLIL